MKLMIPCLVIAAIVSPSTRASHVKKPVAQCHEEVITQLHGVFRYASTFVQDPCSPFGLFAESVLPSHVALLKDLQETQEQVRVAFSQTYQAASSNALILAWGNAASEEVRVIYKCGMREALASHFEEVQVGENGLVAPRKSVFEEVWAFDKSTLRPLPSKGNILARRAHLGDSDGGWDTE